MLENALAGNAGSDSRLLLGGKELISGLFMKMYELRDHIFGFTKELKEQTTIEINSFFTRLNSMESYLDNDLFDDLIEIGRIFKNINFQRKIVLPLSNFLILEMENIPR